MSSIIVILQVLTGLAIAGLAFAARNALPSFLAEKGKNLATKQDIAEITHEVERVRLAFAEHQARSSILFEKQLDAVGGTYERLHDAAEFAMHMVHPVQFGDDTDEQQRRTQAGDAFNNLSGFYWKHRLYLPDDICEQIEALLATMKSAVLGYKAARDHRGYQDSIEQWDAAYKKMRDEVPILRASLEARFRELPVSRPPA